MHKNVLNSSWMSDTLLLRNKLEDMIFQIGSVHEKNELLPEGADSFDYKVYKTIFSCR